MPRTTKAKLTQKKLDSLHTQINDIVAELNTAFLEKSDEIEGLVIGLLANENVCMVGAAGEAKSDLTNCFTSLLGGHTFNYQVGAFTQPDNIFGIESLKELRDNDRKILKTSNMAPDADIVYLDEVFKANNAMMNSLLLILNERQVDIGEGIRMKTNNRMVVGTSNEYPEDEELKAFWDRWVIRFRCTTLQKDDSFQTFWNGYGTGNIGIVDTKKAMKMSDVDLLRDSLWLVDSSSIFNSIKQLRFELMRHGIILSTRRWGKLKKILHAVALRNGRLVSAKNDLKFLTHCIWNTEDQISVVANCISESIGGDLNVANKALAVAQRVYNELSSANLPDKKGDAIKYLANKKDEIEAVEKDCDALDLSDPEVKSVVDRITQLRTDVGHKIFDIVSNRS